MLTPPPTKVVVEAPGTTTLTRTMADDFPLTPTFDATAEEFIMLANYGSGADKIFLCPKNEEVKLGCTDSGSTAVQSNTLD